MKSDVYVVFTTNNARIIKNPSDEMCRKLEFQKNVVKNPSLSKVYPHSPHFWKLKKGKVVLMNHLERTIRSQEIVENRADNDISGILRRSNWRYAAAIVKTYGTTLLFRLALVGAGVLIWVLT